MKRGLKDFILLVAKYLGWCAIARFVTRNSILIIGWHGVSIDDEHTRFPLYFVSPETLANRLRYLRKHYKIISLDEAVRQHESGKIKPRQAVLTFDDALSDFTTAAIPVLRKFDVTGTVYAVSSKINNAIAHRMAATDVVLRSQQAKGGSATLVDIGQREALAVHQQNLSDLKESDRYDYLRSMAAEFGVDFDPVLEKRIWNFHYSHELKQLVQDGFDVQSHSHTHRDTVEPPDRVYDEVATCREIIEKTTNTPADHYCYPSGIWTHQYWEPLKKAGMRSAVTCKVGPNFLSTPRLALRRFIDDNEISQLDFEASVSGWKWLAKVIFNPRRWSVPSEAPYRNSPYI